MGTIPTPPDAPDPANGGWQSGAMAGGPVPYRADRWAKPGEMCDCGLPAVVVYVNKDRELPYCGGDEEEGGRIPE